MKRNWSKRLIVILLIVALTATMISFTGSLVASAEVGSYYSGITAKSGKALLGQLHDLITTTHKKYTSYDDCKNPNYIILTDQGSDADHVRDFYTQTDLAKSWGAGKSGTWNREHVWCQSLSNGMWGTTGGGSDLHHIRPVESNLNSTRGNSKFGDVNKQNPKYSYDKSLGGYLANDTFEPLDSVKGDVARVVMYVYTHYNTYANVGGTTNGSGGGFGTLKFTDVIQARTEEAAIALLLKWNEEDPVDQTEIDRNEAVYNIQGNRNPFVDNQDYAKAIWGGDDLPISKLTGMTISESSLELVVGQTKRLSVSPIPADADATSDWSSSNESVVTVRQGLLTAVAEGTAVVTATSVSNPSITASATVTVKESGGGEQGESGFIVINQASFDMTTGYSFKNWSAGGIGGIAFIYGGNSSYPLSDDNGIQFNISKDSYYLASNVATPAPIKSITVTMVEGKPARKWKLLTSNGAYGEVAKKPTNGTDHGTQTVSDQGVTWELSGCKDTYFALTCEETGSSAASYFSSIVIEYESASTVEPTPTGLEITPDSLTLEKENATIEAIRSAISVNVVYSDGSKKATTSFEIEGFIPSVVGLQTVTIKVGNLSKTMSVFVKDSSAVEPYPTALEVTPTSVTLKKANSSLEALRDALTVNVIYSDGSKKSTTSFNISGFEPKTVGAQTVTISVDELSKDITVTVEEEIVSDRIGAFIASVDALQNANSYEELYNAILNAIDKYNALSESEKADEEVVANFAILQVMVEAYNINAEIMNADSTNATQTALFVVLGVFTALGAMLYLIKQRLV